MIAPEPFFEPRGTPFSELHRLRALTELGHEVDLVTYPFGADVAMAGLRIFRCARPPFMHSVKIGPSMAKLALDFTLVFAVVRRALAGGYDAVHSHEEGGLIGVVIAALLRLPHLYDMHSSLPQQLSNFAFTRSSIVKAVFTAMERVMVRRSRVVIVVCPTLEDTVRAIDPQAAPILIENAMGGGEELATIEEASEVRRSFGFQDTTPLIVYTGTFEAYQGLDLLFDAVAIVRRQIPEARLLMAGGRPDQIAAARGRVDAAGASDAIVFAGEQPARLIPAYLLAADVLVSPRSRGSNTPLKIYQYLRSGRPIVATRLLTHTQVLSDETAVLTGATAAEFAAGILAVLKDPVRAASLGRRAHEVAETKYSHQAYVERTRQAYEALVPSASPTAVVKDPA